MEEFHLTFVLVHGQIPTFIQAESFIKPFRSNVVQPAKLEQSYSDYFGASAHLQSDLVLTRMREAKNDFSSTFSSQSSLAGQAVTLDTNEPAFVQFTVVVLHRPSSCSSIPPASGHSRSTSQGGWDGSCCTHEALG